MKVRELIEALQECDPELDVTYEDKECWPEVGFDVRGVTTKRISNEERDYTWVEIS